MQVKLREMTILDLQKKISEGDGKLKQQQTLCRSPRLRRLAPAPAMPLACAHPRERQRHLCALARKLRYEAVRSDRNLYSKNLIESQVRCARREPYASSQHDSADASCMRELHARAACASCMRELHARCCARAVCALLRASCMRAVAREQPTRVIERLLRCRTRSPK